MAFLASRESAAGADELHRLDLIEVEALVILARQPANEQRR